MQQTSMIVLVSNHNYVISITLLILISLPIVDSHPLHLTTPYIHITGKSSSSSQGRIWESTANHLSKQSLGLDGTETVPQVKKKIDWKKKMNTLLGEGIVLLLDKLSFDGSDPYTGVLSPEQLAAEEQMKRAESLAEQHQELRGVTGSINTETDLEKNLRETAVLMEQAFLLVTSANDILGFDSDVVKDLQNHCGPDVFGMYPRGLNYRRQWDELHGHFLSVFRSLHLYIRDYGVNSDVFASRVGLSILPMSDFSKKKNEELRAGYYKSMQIELIKQLYKLQLFSTSASGGQYINANARRRRTRRQSTPTASSNPCDQKTLQKNGAFADLACMVYKFNENAQKFEKDILSTSVSNAFPKPSIFSPAVLKEMNSLSSALEELRAWDDKRRKSAGEAGGTGIKSLREFDLNYNVYIGKQHQLYLNSTLDILNQVFYLTSAFKERNMPTICSAARLPQRSNDTWAVEIINGIPVWVTRSDYEKYMKLYNQSLAVISNLNGYSNVTVSTANTTTSSSSSAESADQQTDAVAKAKENVAQRLQELEANILRERESQRVETAGNNLSINDLVVRLQRRQSGTGTSTTATSSSHAADANTVNQAAAAAALGVTSTQISQLNNQTANSTNVLDEVSSDSSLSKASTGALADGVIPAYINYPYWFTVLDIGTEKPINTLTCSSGGTRITHIDNIRDIVEKFGQCIMSYMKNDLDGRVASMEKKLKDLKFA